MWHCSSPRAWFSHVPWRDSARLTPGHHHRLMARTAVLLVLGTGVAEAQKTDSVWIRNGDRITGEVKSLSHGLLNYSTDDLGTIYIEWDKVDRIHSPTTFEVQLRTGDKVYGALGLATSGRLVLAGDTIPLFEIVAIVPIRKGLIARMDGYVDLGLSYQNAHNAFQLTSGVKVRYRGPSQETVFELTTFREDRDDAEETSRLSGGLTERIWLNDVWSTGLAVGYERNEELDLSGRLTLIGFGARVLSRTNNVDFWITGGLVLTREQYFSSDTTTTGYEGLLTGSFSAFRYDRPKLNLSVVSRVYPSFSVPGRVRLQNDLRVSYELVKDFMLTVTFFDTFDSKPQSATAAKNDYGTTLAISWTF